MSQILPRFDFRVEVTSSSQTGPIRETNEDAILVAPDAALFAVADGMGGLEAGEIAARTAVETIKSHLTTKAAVEIIEAYVRAPDVGHRRKVLALMRAACEAAHTRVVTEAAGTTRGSTLDVCLLARDKAFISHVGDARVFIVRPAATLLLTQDQVSRRNGMRALKSGIGLPSELKIDTVFVDLERGDRVVLTTDGVHGAMDEATLGRLSEAPMDNAATGLVEHALARGSRDNLTALVIRIGERFLKRASAPASQRSSDLGVLQQNPLFDGLPAPLILSALAAGVEVEVDAGGEIVQEGMEDLCAYLVIDGTVKSATGVELGAPALLFGESLVSVTHRARPYTATSRVRMVRIRADDFSEVCRHDPGLAAPLYERLARHLARTSTVSG